MRRASAEALGRSDHEIGAKELVGLSAERQMHAIGEKSHGRDARHRDHNGRRDQRKLARPVIAPKKPQGELEFTPE